MLIALLAVLGADLVVLVFLVAVLLSRRAWVSRQRGAFKGVIRVVDGEVPGLRRKWKRGVGRPGLAISRAARTCWCGGHLFHPWRVMAMRRSGRMLTVRPAHAAVRAR